MSKGFGMLTSLKELSLYYCEALGSLPESESPMTSHFLISNFGNLMSEGFGQLANLQTLILGSDFGGCENLRSLPESESAEFPFSEFLILEI